MHTAVAPTGAHLVHDLMGGFIALPRIEARLNDLDGSETLKVELLGLPGGAVVTDGTRTVTFGEGDVLNVIGWDLSNLAFKPVGDCATTVRLQVRGTSTEASNGATASVTQEIAVKVLSGTAVAGDARPDLEVSDQRTGWRRMLRLPVGPGVHNQRQFVI